MDALQITEKNSGRGIPFAVKSAKTKEKEIFPRDEFNGIENQISESNGEALWNTWVHAAGKPTKSAPAGRDQIDSARKGAWVEYP